MTGGRAADVHRRIGVDAARIFRVADDLPFAVVAAHLDHRAAMRGHLDVDELRRHLGEHHVLDVLPRRPGNISSSLVYSRFTVSRP